MQASGVMHGHKIDQLDDGLAADKAGYEDVRIGFIKLAIEYFASSGRNSEMTTFFFIENSAKDAGRIESRQAEPIDRAILIYERGSLQVADDSVA